ncbi:MAG: hypothetical protein KAG98_04525 [Lentisphaeria bacterium]|nr:hypothetical protein [Lentisphaeria bacterium]
MEVLGLVFYLVGLLIAIVYSILFLVEAFKVHVGWGLGCMFLPIVPLVFLILHWDVAKRPFLRSLLAIPFYLIGGVLVGMTVAQNAQ